MWDVVLILWFHSEVKFLARFRHLFGLIVILPYFNAISVDFCAVKCLIYIYFVKFPCSKWKNAYIKDLNALRIFNEFSIYLFS